MSFVKLKQTFYYHCFSFLSAASGWLIVVSAAQSRVQLTQEQNANFPRNCVVICKVGPYHDGNTSS